MRSFFNLVQYEKVKRTRQVELETELKRMKLDDVVSKYINIVINDALDYC